MKKSEWLDIFAELKAAYPDRAVTAGTVAIYFAALEGYPVDAVMRAVSKHLLKSRFFPSIAELNELIVLEGEVGVPSASAAWDEVSTAASVRGYKGQPAEWSHPRVEAAVRAIGWHRICYADEGVWLRKDFERVYGEIGAAEVEQARTAPALGNLGSARRLTGRQNKAIGAGEAITRLLAPATGVKS